MTMTDLSMPVFGQPPFSCQNSPSDDAGGCHAVWLEVINLAIRDAASTSESPAAVIARREARAWLFGCAQRDDFSLVCHLAGLEPSFVRKRLALALDRGISFAYLGNVIRVYFTQH